MLARPPLQHSKNRIQPAAMEQAMSQAVKTTDHDEIRTWAEERNGRPAVIRTKGRKGGVLRLDFGEPEDDLKEIEWDEFFEIFDDANLAFLDRTGVVEGKSASVGLSPSGPRKSNKKKKKK